MQGDRSLVSRQYGEETDRGFEIAMDRHTEAVVFAKSEKGRRWREWLVSEVAQVDAGDDAPQDYDAARSLRALYLAADDTLPTAEAIYATEDVVELVETAWRTIPAVGVLESDLIVPSGFVWFARPIPSFWGDVPLIGFSWVPTPASDSDKPIITIVGYGEAGTVVAPKQVSPVPLPDEARIEGDRLAQLAASFWLLAGQRLMGSSRERPHRAVRRRSAGSIDTVVVVTLRRRTYPETDGTKTVAWTHRWLTRGHWRQQWFPSEGRHKPIWIAAFVKGPEDKPFVAKQRAFEASR